MLAEIRPEPVKLLLVEDDAVDRMAIERALAGAQPRVELSVVVDAEAALTALAQGGFDCVLLDYNLPRGSGLTVLQALRERDDPTPVIAMTGHGDEALVVELMKAGASDYIAKHALTADRLAQSIRSALLLREARSSVLKSQQALQEQLDFAKLLVGIVSHDLRNPLQAISMSVALLERRGDLPAESLKAVGRIKSSSQRAVRLIRDLLDFTQARSGGIPVNPEPVDLVGLVQTAVEEISLANPGRDIRLHSPDALSAAVDADRMAQVASNLLSNALAYGAASTPIEVSLRREDASALLEVHNHGEAISPERMAVLFEPMRRLSSDPRRAGSLGLGLYIVDSIVRAHGGSVEVQSLSEGTRVSVRLPLRQDGLHA
jgi:signal transduction histidine kinase